MTNVYIKMIRFEVKKEDRQENDLALLVKYLHGARHFDPDILMSTYHGLNTDRVPNG